MVEALKANVSLHSFNLRTPFMQVSDVAKDPAWMDALTENFSLTYFCYSCLDDEGADEVHGFTL